jgi:two-component system cell cycle response regulator
MKIITTTPINGQQPVATGRYACLVQIYPTGNNIGQRFSLGDTPVVIGRSHDSDIAVLDHGVSRKHVRLEPTPEGFYVSDLVSSNGTYINERRIDGAEMIRDGDYLRIGETIYRFLAGGNIESDYQEEIYRLTIKDALTHMHNRRYMLEFLERELARTNRHKPPLAFLLIDIDRFKSINDMFGRLAGDSVLRELAAIVCRMVQCEDLLARYGGEEFGVVLVETPPAVARGFAERLRETIERHEFQFEKDAFRLTVSVGVACTTGDSMLSTKDIVELAEQRLREAKRAGRNLVVGVDAGAEFREAPNPKRLRLARAV